MKPAAGFTLIEVLVAVVVFAILSATAYGALNALSRSAAMQREHAERLSRLQLTVARLDADLRQLTNRPMRNPRGQTEPPLLGSPLSLTGVRAGWHNPAGLKRSDLQRFNWHFEDGELLRRAWPVTDPLDFEPPLANSNSPELSGFQLRYGDPDGRWHTQWPVPGRPAGQLPRAVEYTLSSAQFGTIRRLIVLAP